ncbi:MAG TPA: sugar O-acetyltransferase [Jiangellales bacterium]|nr:sugar O-acetyltransferase [Jiangellales bacterium]
MGEMKDRMLAGLPYIANDPDLRADALRARKLEQRYNTWPADDPAGRDGVLRELLGVCGESVAVRPPFHVDYGWRISIGSGTFVNFGGVFLDVAEIRIGADVQMGPHVQLLTPMHPLDPAERRAGWESAEPIAIGDNVWLGGGVVVCPGVTIGADTVVGAGAVVTSDLPEGVVAVGNPARVIRSVP